MVHHVVTTCTSVPIVGGAIKEFYGLTLQRERCAMLSGVNGVKLKKCFQKISGFVKVVSLGGQSDDYNVLT